MICVIPATFKDINSSMCGRSLEEWIFDARSDMCLTMISQSVQSQSDFRSQSRIDEGDRIARESSSIIPMNWDWSLKYTEAPLRVNLEDLGATGA